MTSAGGCLGSGFSTEFRAFTAACLPSWCGIFVYRDDTSVDARMHLSGSGFSISRINSVVSFINEGRSLIRGWSQMSTNSEMFSVMLLQLDTIGRIPIGFLWIFLRKYSLEVLWFLGGMQNSFISLWIMPAKQSDSNLESISALITGVISVSNGLYTDILVRWPSPSLIYCSLSWTTIVEPLSALLITMSVLFEKFASAILWFLVRLSFFVCVYSMLSWGLSHTVELWFWCLQGPSLSLGGC